MGKRIQDDESQILVQVDEDDGARQPFASIKRWLVIASLFIVSLLCIGYHPGLPAVISSSLDPHHTQVLTIFTRIATRLLTSAPASQCE